ncbi:hypothetical protein FHS85_001303 [Rhodoligotrophos appendicifer]|uniref:MOSC domain-containing protein n=1 Tax=Rhodoligotrophos appendicifer TaxID=987056 RepID=UPI0014795233|nr:MOSC domain-containing protein [Rhodoligotrophos appendicifer]
MSFGKVAAVWRYPVSSLGGEVLPQAEIDETGIKGDRIWGVAEAATNGIAKPEGEKKWRVVADVLARTGEAGIEIQSPNGGWLPAGSPEAEQALQDHFGFPVQLKPHGAAFESRETVAPRYRRKPIHLLTSASLRTLKSVIPESVVDERRFRPNILVDLPEEADEGFAEGRWIRKEIRIGAVRLYVLEPCERCAFTMVAQRDIPFDKSILAAISSENGKGFGVLCQVLDGGTIRPGDPVEVV